MNLTEVCMAGAELRDPAADDYFPLDVALTGDAVSLALMAGWWRGGNLLDYLVRYPRPLVPSPDRLDVWAVQDADVQIGVADSGTMRRLLGQNRDESDYDRPQYLAAVLALKADFPDVRCDEWIAAVMARPVRDAATDYVRAATAERDMARLYMVDGDGRTVDVMVMDDREAVQAGQDPFFARAVDDFAAQGKDRPPLADYVNWLAGQTPYGGLTTLAGPTTFRAGGFLNTVASGLMTTRRT